MDNPTLHELRQAKKLFEALLGKTSLEYEFQELFTRHPFIFSRSLPFQINPCDIKPLGRPGKSEPDFVFYPKDMSIYPSYGVIEIKRPNTKLFSEPRKEVIVLSRDIATAIQQSEKYSLINPAYPSPNFGENIVIGNHKYIFIIAGLSEELSTRYKGIHLVEEINKLIPKGCQIIPYDILLKLFSSGIPPLTFIVTPISTSSISELDTLDSKISNNKNRASINDKNMDFWLSIEREWRRRKYIGTQYGKQLLDRNFYCIQGTNELATETDNDIVFKENIERLISMIKWSLTVQKTLMNSRDRKESPGSIGYLLSSRQLGILKNAAKYCQKHNIDYDYLEPNDPDTLYFLAIGIIRFSYYDSGETTYNFDSTLIKLLIEMI